MAKYKTTANYRKLRQTWEKVQQISTQKVVAAFSWKANVN